MFYQSYFPTTCFYVVPIDSNDITRDNWYQSEQAIARVLGELN